MVARIFMARQRPWQRSAETSHTRTRRRPVSKGKKGPLTCGND